MAGLDPEALTTAIIGQLLFRQFKADEDFKVSAGNGLIRTRNGNGVDGFSQENPVLISVKPHLDREALLGDHATIATRDRNKILIGVHIAVCGRTATKPHVQLHADQDRSFIVIGAQRSHIEDLARETHISVVDLLAFKLHHPMRVIQRERRGARSRVRRRARQGVGHTLAPGEQGSSSKKGKCTHDQDLSLSRALPLEAESALC